VSTSSGADSVGSLDPIFDDVMRGNSAYQDEFELGHMTDIAGIAAQGLAVVTCMDSRIEPLALLGLKPGDAKILRNAGAHVTESVLRDLTLASHLLKVDRVMVIAHTRCRMASSTAEEVIDEIDRSSGIDVRSLEFGLISDQAESLHHDVQRIRSWPFLRKGVTVGGFLYDVTTGGLQQLC
jgi:carbonic anhydrase